LRRRNASHTNSPVTASPRSRNHQVVGAALVAKAAGRGHRSIAADLHRPASTVRRWLRAVRGEHGRWLYRQGVEHTFRFAPEVLGEMVAHPTELGDALAALAAAALAFRRRDRSGSAEFVRGRGGVVGGDLGAVTGARSDLRRTERRFLATHSFAASAGKIPNFVVLCASPEPRIGHGVTLNVWCAGGGIRQRKPGS
jgi:hypothetical protein